MPVTFWEVKNTSMGLAMENIAFRLIIGLEIRKREKKKGLDAHHMSQNLLPCMLYLIGH